MSDSPKTREPSVCASCGETFGCGAKLDDCWCTEVTLSEETTAAIAKAFDGCLCPRCLGTFATEIFRETSEGSKETWDHAKANKYKMKNTIITLILVFTFSTPVLAKQSFEANGRAQPWPCYLWIREKLQSCDKPEILLVSRD